MSTLLQLKTNIASELHRSDLGTQIANAITKAIDHYSKERWWFLEGRGTSTTVSGQAFYAIPTDLQNFDSLLVTISGSKSPLTRKSYNEIDAIDTGASNTGQPSIWAYYADQIRYYPVPNNSYTMTLSYHKKLATLTDSDSNSWTTDAENLIQYRATWDVLNHYLKDREGATFYKQSEAEAYAQLQHLNTARISSGKTRKITW